MRKGLLLLVGIAVLWVPAVSFGGDSPSKQAAKAQAPHPESAASDPVKTCKSQVYRRNTGEGRGAGANGFGKCVSTIAKHKAENDGEESAKSHDKTESQGDAGSEGKDDVESQGKTRANPARACKAMQTNALAQFQTAYGSRPNAFGKCVSGHANGKG